MLKAAFKKSSLKLVKLALGCLSCSRQTDLLVVKYHSNGYYRGYRRQRHEQLVTMLHFIALHCDVSEECISYILNLDPMKANLHEITLRLDSKGDTALHLAALVGNVRFLNQLLALIEDSHNLSEFVIANRNKKSETAFHVAAKKGQLQVFDCLFKACIDNADSILSVDENGESLVHVACRNLETLQYIIDLYPVSLQKTMILMQDNSGNTPVHLAAYGRPAIAQMRYMLCCLEPKDKIALLCMPNKTGHNPVHLASYRGTRQFVGILNELGNAAEIVRCLNTRSNEGNSPLMRALCNCDVLALTELLSLFREPSLMALHCYPKGLKSQIS